MQVLPTGGPARIPCYLRECVGRSERRAYERADVNTLAFALTGSQRYQQQKFDVHPVADRTLTVLEAKRLQVRPLHDTPRWCRTHATTAAPPDARAGQCCNPPVARIVVRALAPMHLH